MEADERIIEMRHRMAEAKAMEERYKYENEAVNKELTQSIYDEQVAVFGKTMVFADRLLLDGLVSLRVPEEFKAMDAESVKQIYPLGTPPQVVLSNELLDFSVGLQYTEIRVSRSGLREQGRILELMLKRLGPGAQIISNEMTDCGPERLPVISFISQALDSPMCNYFFCACVKGRLLFGFVNFIHAKRIRLEPIANEVIKSFRVLWQEEENT